MTAKEIVKAEWPDAESTYGTFGNLGIRYWIEDVSGEDLSGGKVFDSLTEAWQDAASRLATRTPQADKEEK